jgi:uncharacterized protein (DUF488 family)
VRRLHAVLTIGHSSHPIEAFVELLRQQGVTAVADVRSAPFSRFNPQFNRGAVEQSLRSCGIKYVFLGHELVGRSSDPSCYENGKIQYARLARTSLFQSGLSRLIQGSREHRITLMCAEKEPLECHRTLLVARALDERGVAVEHIHADGRLEPHRAALMRLLDVVGPAQDLFRTLDQLIAEALARQEERIAYVDEMLSTEVRRDA